MIMMRQWKQNKKVSFEEGIMMCTKKKLIEGNNNSVNEDTVATNQMTGEQRENFEC